MDAREALIEAGRRRLRPILMTTLTTILGLLPLALGIGEGSDAQAPLARAVIGGLTGSTLITLVLIPVVRKLGARLTHAFCLTASGIAMLLIPGVEITKAQGHEMRSVNIPR